MSQKLISLNKDLKKLRDEGYEIEINGGYILAHHIPYVNSKMEISYGTLVSKLDLAGDRTVRPIDHVISFSGEAPCNNDGSKIQSIYLSNETKTLCEGVVVNHSFSSKPPCGYYQDFYEKITTYATIISSQAESIDPYVSAKTFKVNESTDPNYVFNYHDTNSSRAEIDLISAKLQNLKIAIIGLGGTGSYVLDFASKTLVKEIHLFDNDDFLSHNAFRTPGAASIVQLRQRKKKVDYLFEIYSNMHKNIIPHPHKLIIDNLQEISGTDFVFICIDRSDMKKVIIEKLLSDKIPFIDVGMGIQINDGSINGCIRTTTCTDAKSDHIDKRITLSVEKQNEYSQNIQIADLNALNAAFAVIRWKKMYGQYHNLSKEYDSSYIIETNELINDDFIT